MKTKTVTLYEFDELSDDAKEKAREWWRTGFVQYDEWWQSVYEDAEMVHLEITSFDLDHGEISGRFTDDPTTTADEIIDNHGEDCGTYKTASAFLQERDKTVDEWPKTEDGDTDDEYGLDRKLDEIEDEFLHDILEDYRIMLQKELEYQMSDENVDECIRINEYTFTEDGERED